MLLVYRVQLFHECRLGSIINRSIIALNFVILKFEHVLSEAESFHVFDGAAMKAASLGQAQLL
jgi:hypothetical protein